MKQPTQPQIDITKTTPVLTPSGNQIWVPGYILRKANKFLTGSAEDMLLPVQVFYDPTSGEICKEALPEAVKFLFEDTK